MDPKINKALCSGQRGIRFHLGYCIAKLYAVPLYILVFGAFFSKIGKNIYFYSINNRQGDYRDIFVIKIDFRETIKIVYAIHCRQRKLRG